MSKGEGRVADRVGNRVSTQMSIGLQACPGEFIQWRVWPSCTIKDTVFRLLKYGLWEGNL